MFDWVLNTPLTLFRNTYNNEEFHTIREKYLRYNTLLLKTVWKRDSENLVYWSMRTLLICSLIWIFNNFENHWSSHVWEIYYPLWFTDYIIFQIKQGNSGKTKHNERYHWAYIFWHGYSFKAFELPDNFYQQSVLIDATVDLQRWLRVFSIPEHAWHGRLGSHMKNRYSSCKFKKGR